MALDVVLAVFATWAAYSLRLETLHRPQGTEWWIYLSGPLIAIPIFIRMGLYRAIFRYTGFDALVTTGQAVGLYAMVHLAVLQWYWWPTFPLTLGPKKINGDLVATLFLFDCHCGIVAFVHRFAIK